MNEENTVPVLLSAILKNSTEMRVWHLRKCLPRSRHIDHTLLQLSLQLSLLPTSFCAGLQLPIWGGKTFRPSNTLIYGFPPLCHIFSETTLMVWLWTNEHSDSYCFLKKYLGFT